MKLWKKHENQFQIVHADFSGGLNTSTSDISENQLSKITNLEVDHATGKLRTVAGTTDILNFNSGSPKIVAAMFDEINQKLLLVREPNSANFSSRSVVAVDFFYNTIDFLGNLSGDLYPICASWEDGILIASGGKLQYFNGNNLVTLNNSPNASNVWVSFGRVFVIDDNKVICSGIGDEENWAENTNDNSSAKFIEVGYKDGGQIFSVVKLSSDVLILKNNRRAYRLSGEYPNWFISEVSRNVAVCGRMSNCAVADLVFVLGDEEVQNIQATNSYGEMKSQNIAILIEREIRNLSGSSILRYVPKLNQIWILNDEFALIFDLVMQSWYKRQFNSQIVDVITAGDEVFIIKPDRVSKLDENTFFDSGEPLIWEFKCKNYVSLNDFLLKKMQIFYTPQDYEKTAGEIFVGKVKVNLKLSESGSSTRRKPLCDNVFLAQSRNVYRNKFLEIGGRGSGGGIIFNSIILDVVEV